MITKENLTIVSDNPEHQELVELYNKWYKDTAFLSSWPADNQYWKEMREYCILHKDIVKEFWVDKYDSLGEVGHFTFMLHEIFPNTIEVCGGYVPLSDIEKMWALCLIVKGEDGTPLVK